MKALLFSLVLAFGFSLRAQADFTIVQKVENKGASSEITLKIKGDRIRMEATPQMTMIVDSRTGDTITLMNAQKKFIRISGETTKAIGEMAAKYGGTTVETPKFVATGKKTTINGYEAEEYVGETSTFKASYWIAPKFPDSAAILKQLQAVTPTAWSDLAKGMLDYRDLPGFPLKTRVQTGEEEIICTVTAVKSDPLSEAEFLAPKDFQEMKMPNVKEISGVQTTPAPPSRP
jgi:hypothetical protein